MSLLSAVIARNTCMCNRYVAPDEAAIERAWHIGRHNQPKWAAEVYPRALGPFLRGQGELIVGTWGLIPPWATTVRSSPLNTGPWSISPHGRRRHW